MIKSVKIKCPLCREESELFLSMNPTVIVLNCPECWTPLMYTKEGIRVLSENELNKITAPAPSADTVLENIFDKITHKKTMREHNTSYKNSLPMIPSHPVYAPSTVGDGRVITNDDIIDLRIELGQCEDVLQFIKRL